MKPHYSIILLLLSAASSSSIAAGGPLSTNLAQWQFSKTALDSPEAKWEKVTIPHCWNATDAQQGGGKENGVDFGYYRGPGTYKTSFPSAAGWDLEKSVVFIRFNAVSSQAKVTLNGNVLGEHLGAFASFGYDITEHLAKNNSPNQLIVEASNAYRKDIVPLAGDFPVYGGMYRPVTLEVRPKVCISPIIDGTWGVKTFQTNVSKESAALDVVTTVYNATGNGTEGSLSVILKDKAGKTVAQKTEKVQLKTGCNDFKTTLNIKSPTLWHGRANPYLYSLSVHVKTDKTEADAYTASIGFRDVRFDPEKGFFLNGENIKLKGVCLHQDWDGIGWALTPEHFKANASLIDEIGANAVRLAHYPHAQEMLDECDKRGIVAWSEIPYVNSIGKPKVPGVEEVTKQQLVEMIRQFVNHPSIITWGLSNELLHTATDDPLPLLRELNDLSHAEDPTRKTTVAVNQPNNKALCTISDILALNTYPGWYSANASDMKGALANLHKNYPQIPVAISEYGHGGSIKHHDRNITKKPQHNGPWHPEEYQARGHEKNWEAIAAEDFTWGTFIWNLCDFASVWRDEGDRKGVNDKGLVTFDRKEKKDAFYFYKANWRTDIPVLHLQEKRASPTRDKEVKVRFYSNMKEHIVTVNGTKVAAPTPYSLNSFETRPVPLKKGPNTIIVSARDSKGKTIQDKAVWVLEE